MAKVLKVQTDWPIPPVDRSGGRRRKYPIEGMAVGAMFFVEGRKSKSVSAYISRISKGVEGVFSARRAWAIQREDGSWQEASPDTPGATEGTGVWRIE